MASGAKQRRSQIITELNRTQRLKVADLSDHLGVSEVSIRRDLQILEGFRPAEAHIRRRSC